MKKHKQKAFSIFEIVIVLGSISAILFFITSTFIQSKKEGDRLESSIGSVSKLEELALNMSKWIYTRKPIGSSGSADFSYDDGKKGKHFIEIEQLTEGNQNVVHRIELECQDLPLKLVNYLNTKNPTLIQEVPSFLSQFLAKTCSRPSSQFECEAGKAPCIIYTKKVDEVIKKTIRYPSIEDFKTDGIAGGLCVYPLIPSDNGPPQEVLVSMQIAYIQGKSLRVVQKDRVYRLLEEDLNGPDRNPNLTFYEGP